MTCEVWFDAIEQEANALPLPSQSYPVIKKCHYCGGKIKVWKDGSKPNQCHDCHVDELD